MCVCVRERERERERHQGFVVIGNEPIGEDTKGLIAPHTGHGPRAPKPIRRCLHQPLHGIQVSASAVCVGPCASAPVYTSPRLCRIRVSDSRMEPGRLCVCRGVAHVVVIRVNARRDPMLCV